MQLSKLDITQALSLPTALRAGDVKAISKAVMRIRIDDVEEQAYHRRELEKEVEYLRVHYKHASPANRPAIECKAKALIATIETMPEHPPLTALARKQGTQDVLDDMAILISWFNDQLNIQNKLNVDQIEVTAVTIMGEWGHLMRMEDIAACLRKALKGEYGQIYARLDCAVIMDWLQKYYDDLLRERMNRAEQRHVNIKESLHDGRSADRKGEEKDKNRAALAEYIRTKQA